MDRSHPLVCEFHAACHRHYACYAIARMGLQQFGERIGKPTPGARLFIGRGGPTDGKPIAWLPVEEVAAHCLPDADFSDLVAKSVLVTLYSEWEEYYRPRIAASCGVASKQVHCNLMGDLRHLRNCVVHAKGILTNEHLKLVALKWHLAPGPLQITNDMFATFIEQVNDLEVQIIGAPRSEA